MGFPVGVLLCSMIFSSWVLWSSLQFYCLFCSRSHSKSIFIVHRFATVYLKCFYFKQLVCPWTRWNDRAQFIVDNLFIYGFACNWVAKIALLGDFAAWAVKDILMMMGRGGPHEASAGILWNVALLMGCIIWFVRVCTHIIKRICGDRAPKCENAERILSSLRGWT